MKPQVKEIWQHYKTEGHYEILGIGKLQVKISSLDLEECVIYQSFFDKSIWVRPLVDFLEEVTDEKGRLVARFKKLS